MTLTLQGHLTRAWAHLQQAHTRAAGDDVLRQFIQQAIDEVEAATIRQREGQHEQEQEQAASTHLPGGRVPA